MREKHDMTETEWINWKILYQEKILKFISNYLRCSFKKKIQITNSGTIITSLTINFTDCQYSTFIAILFL